MAYIVYIDVVLAVNTIMGVMVLTTLDETLSCRTTKRRLLTGAVIGDIWSYVVSAMSGLPPVAGVLETYVAANNLTAVVVYHLKSVREIVKSVAGIYLVSMVFGEAMLAFYEHTKTRYYVWRILRVGQGSGIPALTQTFMMTGAVLTYYSFSGEIKELIRSMVRRKDLCRIILKYREREEEVTGLTGTGSRLREPVSDRPVHVAADGFMRRLCPAVEEVVYVPYQSVETSRGTLPTVCIDQMEVEQEDRAYCVRKPLVAVTKRNLSPSRKHQILI